MATLETRLQAILDDHVTQGIVGVSLALRTPDFGSFYLTGIHAPFAACFRAAGATPKR